MERKATFLILVFVIFGLSGCLGGFGFGSNTFTTPFDQRYKIAAALNPKKECTLLMLDKVWVTSKAMFFRPTTNEQLFTGALKGLGDAMGRSVDLPEYKNDKEYTLANFWPILIELKNSSDKTLSELCYSSVYGLVKGLGDTDNIAFDRLDRDTKHIFRDIAGLLVDGSVETFVRVGIMNNRPFSRCVDIPGHTAFVQNPDFALKISVCDAGV